MSFKHFVTNIFPIILITLSTIGNILGLLVLKNKSKLKNLGPINIYRYLFIAGLVNSYMILHLYLESFGIHLDTASKFTCRLTIYYWFVAGPISTMKSRRW